MPVKTIVTAMLTAAFALPVHGQSPPARPLTPSEPAAGAQPARQAKPAKPKEKARKRERVHREYIRRKSGGT